MLEGLLRFAPKYIKDKMLQIGMGLFLLFEGVLALLWFGNDKWLPAQILRLLRILGGVVLILIGLKL